MKRLIAVLSAVLIIISLVCVISFADFGDFGGDADFGDFGGGGGDWDFDDDDGGSGGGLFFLPGLGGSTLEGVIVVIVIIAFIVFAMRKAKKNPNAPKVDVGNRSTPDSELRPVSEYASIDPDFDVADLREKVSNLYVRMQNGWTKKDISDLRPYFTDALFTQFERQLAQKKAQGVTNYIERISVQNVAVRGFKQANGVDHMIIKVEARITDYTLNDHTGQLVSGSREREKFMTYEWDMSRTTGAKTLRKDGVGRIICPSCGAPLNINQSARCEYCDSVIHSSEHDWAICQIKALSQQTL